MEPKQILFCLLISAAFFAGRGTAQHEIETGELAATVSAYRDCMRRAAEFGCRMTPEDFVKYHHAKRELESRE